MKIRNKVSLNKVLSIESHFGGPGKAPWYSGATHANPCDILQKYIHCFKGEGKQYKHTFIVYTCILFVTDQCHSPQIGSDQHLGEGNWNQTHNFQTTGQKPTEP